MLRTSASTLVLAVRAIAACSAASIPAGCSASSGIASDGEGAGSDGPAGASGGAGDTVLFGDDEAPGASTSGIEERDRCGSYSLNTSVESVVEPGNVLIVFDQSDSMSGDFNGTPKWRAAADAVAEALAPTSDMLTVGAIMFPTSSADFTCITFVFPCGPSCVAPISDPEQFPFQPGPQFLQAWGQRWQSANLAVSTPLDSATQQADAVLSSAGLTGQTAVVIVTDGEPTCSLTPGSVSLAREWLQRGVKTHVIGLPGALGAGVLTDIAVAGGTNQFLTPADAAALQSEIQSITSTVIRQTLNDCGIIFNEVPEDLDQVALVVTDSETGEQFRVEQGAEGWQLAADGTRADLMGLTCDEALSGRFSTISFEFGCSDVPVLR